MTALKSRLKQYSILTWLFFCAQWYNNGLQLSQLLSPKPASIKKRLSRIRLRKSCLH